MTQENQLWKVPKKDALLKLGTYAHENLSPVNHKNIKNRFAPKTDARQKMEQIADAFDFHKRDFYIFADIGRCQLVEMSTEVNARMGSYVLSAVDILYEIGRVRAHYGDDTARWYINRLYKNWSNLHMTLASAYITTEYVNGIVTENPKENVFRGMLEVDDEYLIPFILVESNAAKADEMRTLLKKKHVRVLLDRPKPGRTKYNTVRLILDD